MDLNQACPDLVTSADICFKVQWKLNHLFYFSINFLFQKYKLLRVGHEKRSSRICDFQTSPGKIDKKVIIKFRAPEMNEGSPLQNFSFVGLPSRSEPSRHKISLEPYSGATRKDPDPRKIPGSLFDLLNLYAKFQLNSLTLSTLISTDTFGQAWFK